MLSNEQIAMGLDVSTRSVRRVLAHFYANGTIPDDHKELVEQEDHKNRCLDEAGVEVCPYLLLRISSLTVTVFARND